MPLTCYCKKCAADVPVGDHCPNCGAKLAANTVRLAWCVDHTPVKDWMSWNAVARIVLPLAAVLVALMLVLEMAVGGVAGVERMLSGGVMIAVLGMITLGAALILLALMLQGDDVLDCVMDSKGLHVTQYLPEPTAVKLLMRLKSPQMLQQAGPDTPMLLLAQRDIAWKDVARVQLWPEKTLMLLYAPAWWLRLPLYCTPFTWEDALEMVRDKLGRKKGVNLPAELIAPPKPKAPKAVKAKQLTIADIPDVPEQTPMPEADPMAEKTEDFVPLEDVLREIQESEKEQQ